MDDYSPKYSNNFGWWLSHPSEQMLEFVSWDDEIPPRMEK
jgi:hypothetical protein